MTADLDKKLAAEAIKRGAMQKEWELERLIELLIDLDIRSVLEIGSANGAMLWLYTQLADRVVSIDIGPVPIEDQGLAPEQVKLIQCDSRLAYQQVAGDRFDFVFIDADHTFPACWIDYCMYGAHGKLVGFHDIQPWIPSKDDQIQGLDQVRGVSVVWALLRKLNFTKEIVYPFEQSGMGENEGGIGLVMHP